MLQIITGRFFSNGKVNEKDLDAVLYSNFSWIQPIGTTVAELRPADAIGPRISPFVLHYTVRYEQFPGDILVMPSGGEAVEQFRLLASLWFQAFFHSDRYHVEILCRQERRNATEGGVPANFVDTFFGPRHGKASEVDAFAPFIDKVLAMPRKSFRLVVSCLGAFFDALESIDTNRDLAYSMFVYALEALAQSSDGFVPTWQDFPQNVRVRLDKQLAHLDHDRTEAIKSILLDNPHLKLKTRFIEFISDHIEDCFFVSEAITRTAALRKNELLRALGNLYDTRSGYVHSLRPIQQHLGLPHWGSQADVFHWDNEPYLTFSGIVRLARHVFLQFIERQPSLAGEEYASWRGELPGIVFARLAPHLWIGRVDNLQPSHAVDRFNGFLSHLAARLSEFPLTLVDLRPLVEHIERIVPQAGAQDRKVWVCLYGLFHCIVPEELRRPQYKAFVARYEDDADECSIAILAAYVIIGAPFKWPVGKCEAVYAEYLRRKFRANAINLPGIVEVAVMAEIANLHLRGGSIEDFQKWANEAIVNAAGGEAVQAYLKECQDKEQEISLGSVVGIPRPALEDAGVSPEDDCPESTSTGRARRWISDNAYFRWVNEDCEHGHALRHWREAEGAYEEHIGNNEAKDCTDCDQDAG